MINRTRPYRLTTRKKEAIVQHFEGKISQYQLAKELRLGQRERVYHAMYALFRHLAATKKIDVKALLENE